MIARCCRVSRVRFVSIAWLAALLIPPASALAAETYEVDPVHSTVIFRIRHLGVADFYGRINDPTGTVVIDEADPSKSSFNVELKVENIDTHNAKRDAHLKSQDFFHAEQHPTITFKSTSVKEGDEADTLEVEGDLTIKGVTKPITVTVNKIGEGDKGAPFGYRAGWHTQFTVNRNDFGVSFMPGGLGEEVTLMISLEAQRQ